jgi:hypothetical protein
MHEIVLNIDKVYRRLSHSRLNQIRQAMDVYYYGIQEF